MRNKKKAKKAKRNKPGEGNVSIEIFCCEENKNSNNADLNIEFQKADSSAQDSKSTEMEQNFTPRKAGSHDHNQSRRTQNEQKDGQGERKCCKGNKQQKETNTGSIECDSSQSQSKEANAALEKLLASGCEQGLLPVHAITSIRDVTKVRQYFERDPKTGLSMCDPNGRCLNDGSTALLLAIRTKQTEATKVLLENGADVTLTDNSGDNALLAAIKSGDANAINILWPYRGNLDINHANNSGQSALHLAADRKWECCASFLLQNRANPNCQSKSGTTPLMLAAVNGDTKTVDVLLKSGADLLLEDDAGYTCICTAFRHRKDELTQYLLRKLPEDKRDAFIRSRLEKLTQTPGVDEEKRMVDCFYPMLHKCTEEPEFRNVFYNLKIIQKITQRLEEHDLNIELAIWSSHLLFCTMFGFLRSIDVKFVRQFISCKGPDVVIRITKFFTESWKIPEREIIIVFLPMLGLSELNEGRMWLKKNYVSVSEYLNFFHRDSLKICLTWNNECHWGHDNKYIDAINGVWLRFHDVMNEIQTEERERHMAELLEEEEREKEKLSRKKEKKKQKKQERRISQFESEEHEERTLDPPKTLTEISQICLLSKNENANAGQDDPKRQRNSPVNHVHETNACPASLSGLQFFCTNTNSDFPIQNDAKLYQNQEQWTTIPTKRQVQKQKDMKRQTENTHLEVHDKAKNTPNKSPRKKAVKANQNLFGYPVAPTPIQGNTRWADIAKGVAKKPLKQNVQSANIRPQINYSQANLNLGENEFPSLNMTEEEKPNNAKQNCIRPAKFTFTFHEPITELEPVGQDGRWSGQIYVESTTGISFGANDSDLNDSDIADCIHNTGMEEANETTEAGVDMCDDSLIDRVEAECSMFWDDNADISESDIYENQHNTSKYSKDVHVIAQALEPNVMTTEPEDWSKEIDRTERMCARVDNQGTYLPPDPPVQNDTSDCMLQDPVKENVIEGNAQSDDPPDRSDFSVSNQRPADKSCIVYQEKDYVGPENCQVDIFTIIQHQTSTIASFEKHVLANRLNDPFFDPSVSLPNEMAFTDDKAHNALDALFECSEEIPSWFNDDDDTPTNEDTWTKMQEDTHSYVVKEASQKFVASDNVPLDPAIIGYQQMVTKQNCSYYGNQKPAKQILEHPRSILYPIKPGVELSAHSIPIKELRDSIDEQANSNYLSKQEIENLEKQTAIIKPLQAKSKPAIPVSNSAFGQKLLENACRLERIQQDDNVSFPDELGGEPVYGSNANDSISVEPKENEQNPGSSPDDFYFPGFHSATKLSAHYDNRDISMFHRMQQVQLEQLARYYNQYKQQIIAQTPSKHQDTFAYYASCAGINRKDMEDCMNGKMDYMNIDSTAPVCNATENKTFKDIRKESAPEMLHIPNHAQRLQQNREYNNRLRHNSFAPRMMNPQIPQLAGSPILPLGQILPPPPMYSANIHMIQATQAAMAATVMSQIKDMYRSMMKAKMKSVRWREQLEKLRNLPPERQMVVGKIIIPKDECDRIYISYTGSGPLQLGFQTDGTEVAVKVIPWSQRDFTLDELQHLVNLDVSKYFMNKYRAFSSQDGHYYIAMDLFEYSLPEFLHRLSRDEGVDQTTARSKLVWQFMRGLASLHQHCLMVHGELRPENVVLDVDGNVRITGYGLGKNTSRDSPYVECSDDEKCWLAPEVLVRKQKVSFRSDIFVAGMVMYYILSSGKHPFGSQPAEIIQNISEQRLVMEYVTEEAGNLLSLMLSVNKSERPCISDALRHPYFWADEKRLRFILIAGSDVLRDLKAGIPMDGSVRDSMISIIGSAPCHVRIINWIDDIESVIMREMRAFRQYKNNVVELVLFVYNCCLHFDKMSDNAREIIDEPCKYFLNKFPPLFMTVYRAIKLSNRTERTCYKPFF